VTPPLHLGVRRLGRGEADVELSLELASDLALIADAVELLAEHCPPGILSPRRIRFNLRTVIAEALANAITYGNGGDPGKHVHVRVAAAADAVRVWVGDDGDGFDPRTVPDPTAAERLSAEAGRGLFVIRHLVDAVDFNAKGNLVCLTLRAG
jgi:anti-sigma regulatory factor (Ser/Thr protein kinase)